MKQRHSCSLDDLIIVVQFGCYRLLDMFGTAEILNLKLDQLTVFVITIPDYF
jgi:hypothetical protein